jgi:hypothetical protein
MENKIGKMWYPKNKFGVEELLDDQCQNKTCTCSENECKYDNALWEEHYMYQAYRRNLIAAGSKKKEEGD